MEYTDGDFVIGKIFGQYIDWRVLKRFSEWDVDWDNAKLASTSTVRGWERFPVFTH